MPSSVFRTTSLFTFSVFPVHEDLGEVDVHLCISDLLWMPPSHHVMSLGELFWSVPSNFVLAASWCLHEVSDFVLTVEKA